MFGPLGLAISVDLHSVACLDGLAPRWFAFTATLCVLCCPLCQMMDEWAKLHNGIRDWLVKLHFITRLF